MNTKFLRYAVALLAVVLLLQSYVVRELLVTELLLAILLFGLLVVAGTAFLIGYAGLFCGSNGRGQVARSLTLHGKRGASNHDP